MNKNFVSAFVFYSYIVCPRQAWFYHHGLSPEKENPFLVLGRFIHESSYPREIKEIIVDGILKIDLLRGKVVAEIKKSSRHKQAARFQLLYYLWYLKRKKGLHMRGILLFPKEKRVEEVHLGEKEEMAVERLLDKMGQVLRKQIPPPLIKNRFCRSCSFKEFCWA